MPHPLARGSLSGKFWFWTIDCADSTPRLFRLRRELEIVLARMPLRSGQRMFVVAICRRGRPAGVVWMTTGKITVPRFQLCFGFGVVRLSGFLFSEALFSCDAAGLALLAGIAVSSLSPVGGQKTPRFKVQNWAVWVYALTVAITVFTCAGIWFQQSTTATGCAHHVSG